jgi:alpha-L-rhamnosidase
MKKRKGLLVKRSLTVLLSLCISISTGITYRTFANNYGIEERSNNTSAKWIWYPGDFEVWLHTVVAGRRQERGQPYPPFWRVDSPYGLIKFEKSYSIKQPETIEIFSDGRYHVRIDGKIVYGFKPDNFELPAGSHRLQFLVENYNTFPSLLVKGKSVFSDESWLVTNQNQKFYNAASGNFSDPGHPPSAFSLEYTPITARMLKKGQNDILLDFGKETFGKIVIENLAGKGKLKLFYGETEQEALAEESAETFDFIDVNRSNSINDTTETRAFRYIYAVTGPNINFDKISALYEYLPVEYRGEFECSDNLLNKIYEVSLYTLHLNTREFHLDGIKRDRWTWSGDAYQSYLMNFYTFFDEEVNIRTFYALRGHDPVETHINTILDYSFYWLIGIYDHFLYTGDSAFVRQIYPRMKSLMEFCLGRTNKNDFVEGLPGDWVFIDWADIDKKGEISFEQLLLARSLEAMALSADISNDMNYSKKCSVLSKKIKKQIFDTFWSDEMDALVHNRKDGVLSQKVTRYANMFAILFDYADDETKIKIRDNVILNDDILKITTPYMKFYELASLCEIGEKEKAIEFVRNYWGGMLELGATSIWETYDPEQSGNEHYAMYGRPFGKSLCHAWGANPVYLFGKYLLGVEPTTPGYQNYIIQPSLAGLNWIKGKVPTPNGDIEIYMNKEEIKITTTKGEGILRVSSNKPPKAEKGVKVYNKGRGQYDVVLSEPNKTYNISYWGN